ncbi:hypothetical protein EAY46_14900 [Vibrio anguillarum]|uniref:Uncharacterized protein n=2 Tax=Vibrio anguillarum TaxID=55601 RepID=A0ABR9Z7B2_VIBAN|nr:hypothetical protein [Vibrio anguillarum]
MVVFSAITITMSKMLQEYSLNTAIEQQGQRLANISAAVIRYQASGGDPAATPPLLSPIKQFDQAGMPFENGAIHRGLDWLKPVSCGGTAPIELINCGANDKPFLGDDSIFKFTVSNDGTKVHTKIEIVQASDESVGMRIRGATDMIVAAKLSNKAESMTSFTSSGAANTYFTVLGDAIVTSDLGLDVTNSPYLMRNGEVTSTGTQRFENGAGIEGTTNVSSERFSGYDRATNTVSTTRYLDPLGQSILEDVEVQDFKADKATITNGITANDATINNILTTPQAVITQVDVEYINQTNPSVKNTISGELEVGTGANQTLLSQGDVYLSGVVADKNDPSKFLDLDGISSLEDVALSSLGGALLSDLNRYTLVGTVLVSQGQSIPKPNCGTSAQPRLVITPQRWTTHFLVSGQPKANNNVYYVYATSNATTWYPQFMTHNLAASGFPLMADTNGAGLAQIYCRFN